MSQKARIESLESLLATMAILRSPEGCPWDAAQTPESLTPYILEEACELIDAIETEDPDLIKDELGDLLLQVVFQAQIFKERGEFEFADVAAAINAKLLRRHPHVFEKSGSLFDNIELERQWNEIKQREKAQQRKSGCISEHLPSRLPSLQRAQKLIGKAAEFGLPFPIDLTEVHSVVEETDLTEEGLGRMLLGIVAQAHQAGFDAERALRKTIQAAIEQISPEEET